ncbi:MAG: serine/threonine protein kinase, partial [Deltaproteobacteria bacterium]|nr:serine/threonine protein kinase [Deltaproteobacteria bacterium]
MEGSPAEAFGPYLVYEQLGMGGMASVHRAEMGGIEGFRRPVALKRMLPHVAADAEMVQAFVREAHLASHLRHANVAQTYDLGKVGDIYFIAMELITGKSLREILKHGAATTGPMPVAVALNILNQMCDALDYAHNLCDERGKLLGIIHRDVSPSNIIVADDGVVKLIDFGIAKVTSSSMQTMAGTIKGKFGYMAPEYIAGSIDARADLFALGVIAHELLTNRPLFTGPDDMETLHRVRRMDILPPSRRNPQVPPEVDDIVMTALARDPDRRWQHATALRNAMTTVTRRLGLAIHNSQVVDWVRWAFQQKGPLKLAGHTINLDDDDPSIAIERPTSMTRDANQAPDVSSDQMTMMLMNGIGAASPDTPMPAGTPAHITAQPAPQPDVAAYHDAVAAYERGESADDHRTMMRPQRDTGSPPIAYPGMRTSG